MVFPLNGLYIPSVCVFTCFKGNNKCNKNQVVPFALKSNNNKRLQLVVVACVRRLCMVYIFLGREVACFKRI